MVWASLAEPASSAYISTISRYALEAGSARLTRLRQRVLKENTAMERIGLSLLFLDTKVPRQMSKLSCSTLHLTSETTDVGQLLH